MTRTATNLTDARHMVECLGTRLQLAGVTLRPMDATKPPAKLGDDGVLMGDLVHVKLTKACRLFDDAFWANEQLRPAHAMSMVAKAQTLLDEAGK
jgi:hypothetical protein